MPRLLHPSVAHGYAAEQAGYSSTIGMAAFTDVLRKGGQWLKKKAHIPQLMNRAAGWLQSKGFAQEDEEDDGDYGYAAEPPQRQFIEDLPAPGRRVFRREERRPVKGRSAELQYLHEKGFCSGPA